MKQQCTKIRHPEGLWSHTEAAKNSIHTLSVVVAASEIQSILSGKGNSRSATDTELHRQCAFPYARVTAEEQASAPPDKTKSGNIVGGIWLICLQILKGSWRILVIQIGRGHASPLPRRSALWLFQSYGLELSDMGGHSATGKLYQHIHELPACRRRCIQDILRQSHCGAKSPHRPCENDSACSDIRLN